jgi:hypothetical protein
MIDIRQFKTLAMQMCDSGYNTCSASTKAESVIEFYTALVSPCARVAGMMIIYSS